MKKNVLKIASLVLAAALLLCGCKQEDSSPEDEQITEFSYDMLDLKAVADKIYNNVQLSDLTYKSVSTISDEQTLSEQFYLDLTECVSYEVRSAEGNYGVADVAIIRVKDGCANDVMESLENRKDDRINEFSNYDVYDSYSIALNADIYQTGELVVMLMLPEDTKAVARGIIDSYLP